jgi:hypothetical protein
MKRIRIFEFDGPRRKPDPPTHSHSHNSFDVFESLFVIFRVVSWIVVWYGKTIHEITRIFKKNRPMPLTSEHRRSLASSQDSQ